MKNMTISIILTVFLLIPAGSNANTEQSSSALQIYLPREVTIESNAPNLGQVAIIRGDELLTAKAEKVALGCISAPGQKITVDRAIILSRLACSGIPASQVTLTGAEQITVFQQYQIIKGDEFVEKALVFLKNNPPAVSICQYNPIRTPQDLILSETSEDIRLSPCLANSNIKNQAKVLVSVFSGDKEIGAREVMFFLKYNCRRAVALIDIPQGAVISPENAKVENTASNNPEPANWIAPYGFIANRQLSANTVISADMVSPVKPQILLKRNQTVIIKFDRLGLLVTAIGRALQDGQVGEYIKVQNVDSQRVIMAKVNEDGSVEPVF
ncbi:MAG: flagellar basal body P-ring formation chaperone FlgA [Phycisphaerae bacterium]|nr:flagellar basal body P-ring formation chaperone FlgA [Phycisphaerae bacterium]